MAHLFDASLFEPPSPALDGLLHSKNSIMLLACQVSRYHMLHCTCTLHMLLILWKKGFQSNGVGETSGLLSALLYTVPQFSTAHRCWYHCTVQQINAGITVQHSREMLVSLHSTADTCWHHCTVQQVDAGVTVHCTVIPAFICCTKLWYQHLSAVLYSDTSIYLLY